MTTNTCQQYLRDEAARLRQQNEQEAEFAGRLGISVQTLRLYIEASVKHPGLKWAI